MAYVQSPMFLKNVLVRFGFWGQSPNSTSLWLALRVRCFAALRNWCLTPITISLLQLAACSSLSVDPSDPSDSFDTSAAADLPVLAAATASPWTLASTGREKPSAWQNFRFPGKPLSQFSYVRMDSRDAMRVTAKSSASMWHQVLRVEPADLGRVNFSWNVPELIAQADMALREADDSPVRIVLTFEGDRSRFSLKNTLLSELARALTGEELPYATLMYVWCNQRAPGTVIVNPRTDRIRKLVVESGVARLNQWLDYEQSIRADFEKAFGEPPGALMSVALMTDTDNTKSIARAWYGPLTLAPTVR